MKHTKLILFIFLLFIYTLPTTAQHLIKGMLVEENSKGEFSPVVGANIFWLGTTIGTSTNSDGFFSILHEDGYTRLVASFVGLQSDTLDITDHNMGEMKVILKSQGDLEEITVNAEKSATNVDFLNSIKSNTMTEKELFKAACCNLSESFETNPSIDVNFADAVTGAKQIQMLGLAGIYTQITSENLPGVRGLASNYGLSYTPGTWIESIQVTKGIGSVANGYESIAGQINTELRKPFGEDKLFFNAYANDWGRYEVNLNLTQKISKNWATGLLLHSNLWNTKIDMNNDGFLDLPLGYQLNAVNRWHYDNGKGISAQIGIKIMKDDRTGGQSNFNSDKDKLTTNAYGLNINTERLELWGKIGYVFPQKKYKSIGLMVSGLDYKQDSYYGLTTYTGNQQSFYTNLIYQSIIGNTNHKFRTGLSFLYDGYNEKFNGTQYKRTETVPGVFFEYTVAISPKFNVVAGVRSDYNNLFGWIFTPRLHAKYDITPTTVLRFSAGSGQRTANIFAENTAIFVSSRQVEILNNGNTGRAYGLNPEKAWNFGINLTKEFRFLGKNTILELDYYRTDFSNQVVVDLDNSSQKVQFYDLNGQSYSNSFQAQVTYEPLKRMELRLAYRLFDVHTTYSGQLLDRYLLARDRAFVNLSYKIKGGWNFDYTVTWFGRKRIPNTSENPDQFKKNTYSPDYFVMNSQVTKTFVKNLDIYLGIENILDFRQTDLIVNGQNPFNPYFDASLVWGPVQGRMIYAGLRYRIKNK